MSTDQPIEADPTYSLEAAIKSSVDLESKYDHLDLGPVDTLDPESLEREYDAFFGTSPLSLPSASTLPSRSASPQSNLRDPGPEPLSERPLEPHAPANATPLNSKSRRNRKKSHANRRLKRQEARAQQAESAVRNPRAGMFVDRAECTETSYDTNSIPSASTGFIAIRDTAGPAKLSGVEELLAVRKFKLIQWNGRIERAIVDKDGRVIAVLASHPNDQDWDSVHQTAHAALRHSRARCVFSRKIARHRRGNFPALSAGISFGGGQKVPGNLQHNKPNSKELRALLSHKSFQRMAGFASNAFFTWAPKLHEHYEDNLKKILDGRPKLV